MMVPVQQPSGSKLFYIECIWLQPSSNSTYDNTPFKCCQMSWLWNFFVNLSETVGEMS